MNLLEHYSTCGTVTSTWGRYELSVEAVNIQKSKRRYNYMKAMNPLKLDSEESQHLTHFQKYLYKICKLKPGHSYLTYRNPSSRDRKLILRQINNLFIVTRCEVEFILTLVNHKFMTFRVEFGCWFWYQKIVHLWFHHWLLTFPWLDRMFDNSVHHFQFNSSLSGNSALNSDSIY